MKKILFFTSIFFSFYIYSQSKDIIYFDKDWKETTKVNAAFYRPLPMNAVGNYQLVRDYYINGKLQMQGYSLKNNIDELIGDVYYYDNNNVENISTKVVEGINGTFFFYYQDGKLWKMTTYKNGTLNGNTTYYFKDGTIMFNGLYDNGNCISGSISYDTKLSSYFSLKKNEQEKQITKIIYWENSKQVAQKQIILLQKYGRKLIGLQNFDKSGKLIQKLTEKEFRKNNSYYSESISDGILFEYYIKQGYAINLRSENHYLNDKRNGVSINYDVSGKILNKLIFKNDLPVSGLLEQKLNYNLFVSSNYMNSFKEGEEIAKTDKDSIIATGIYKLGKPFNGRFLVANESNNETENQLQNYNNFKLDGLQQVLDSQHEIIESYVLKNNKKEGIVTIIKDEIRSEIVYKNDLPFDGNLKYKNSETIYKKGFLISETTFRNADPSQISEKKEYENGKIMKVLSSSFYISDLSDKITRQYMQFIKTKENEDKFQGFVGNYKDEKPFSGFFENVKDEFKIVDFYENGVLKYQYSKDWFSTLTESGNQNTELKIKSTFKNGKIVDGYEYINYSKVIAIKKYENSVIKTLDVNFFEMHYYNRLHYEIKKDEIEITDFKYPDIKMILNFKNEQLNQSIFLENKEIKNNGSSIINLNDGLVANSVIYYMQGENEIISTSQSTIETFDESIQKFGSSLIVKGYTSIPTASKSKNVQDLLTEIGDKFVKEVENVKETLFNDDSGNEKSYKVIAELIVDKNGKPENGIWLTKNIDNSHLLRFFLNGKLIKSKDKIALKNCSAESKNYEK